MAELADCPQAAPPQAIRGAQFIVRQRQFRQTPKCQNSFPKLSEYVKPLVTSWLCGRPGISQDGFLDLCFLSEISSRTTSGRKQQAISRPSETRRIPPARGVSQDRSVLDRPPAAGLAFLNMFLYLCMLPIITPRTTTGGKQQAITRPHETRRLPPARGISQDRSVLDRPLAAGLAFHKIDLLI